LLIRHSKYNAGTGIIFINDQRSSLSFLLRASLENLKGYDTLSKYRICRLFQF